MHLLENYLPSTVLNHARSECQLPAASYDPPPSEYWISHRERLEYGWLVADVELFGDAECTKRVPASKASAASSGDAAYTEPAFVLDNKGDTKWRSRSAAGGAGGSAEVPRSNPILTELRSPRPPRDPDRCWSVFCD